jgi:hypothetical protein
MMLGKYYLEFIARMEKQGNPLPGYMQRESGSTSNASVLNIASCGSVTNRLSASQA